MKTSLVNTNLMLGLLILALGAEADDDVRPVPRPALASRIAARNCEVYGIVHWGLNTFTDREWGFGDEDPALLNPQAFDADQIVGACKAGGLKGLVIVAKHHDGFCLWPTRTTGHNISKSPFRGGKGDYVREMEQACRKAGLRFGIYVSPWDRNNAGYATPQYVETYHAQIKELLNGDYGEVFEMWFDGANGGDGYYGGKREKRKISAGYYRFEEVFANIRAWQPALCIFAGESDLSDFRWPGNERGKLNPDSRATIETVGGYVDGHYGNPNYKGEINVGKADGDYFRVCEVDFPLRPGWFYHEKDRGKTKSSAYLMQRYLDTVGNGGTMNLGIAPTKDGRLDEEDVQALKGFGDLQKAFFAHPVTDGGAWNLVDLSEDVSKGERIDAWELVSRGKILASGKSVGIHRMRTLEKPVQARETHLITMPCFGAPNVPVAVRYYFVDPQLLSRVMSAETQSGETDTAKWMTKQKPHDARGSRPLSVAPDKVLSKGFTATLKIDCSKPGSGEELLYSAGPVRLALRQAGKDAKLDGYDRRSGNYLSWPLADGTCPVLEATITERAGRAGIPLGCLANATGVHTVTLQYAPPRWAICVDGHVDEDFPIPACPVVWPKTAVETVSSPRVKSATFVSPARADALPRVPDLRPITKSIQYWTPEGHNTWAGDIAPAYLNDTLHVFYLFDRRHHGSGSGTGRHQFAHLASDDLVHWVEYPFAVAVKEDWQTCGTGTPFLKDGKVAIAFGWHTSRFPERKDKPLGGTYAVSDDGIHFANAGVMISDAQNPSIYNLPDGRYELVTSYGGSIGIFHSRDLLKWDLFDAKLPFRGDCPSLFDWHGHRYLLQGFVNMAYSPDGKPGSFVNWSSEPDILYEGLSVPMVAKWKNDRRLYLGWLNHLYGWGGWLVFREVVAYPDGHLGLKWVPEIVPPTKPRDYAVKGGERFQLRLVPEKGGAPLVFTVDPAAKEASVHDDVKNVDWQTRACSAKNVRIRGVRGLDRDYEVRLIVHYDAKSDATIFDAEIAHQRTIICRRAGRYK